MDKVQTIYRNVVHGKSKRLVFAFQQPLAPYVSATTVNGTQDQEQMSSFQWTPK